MKDRGEGSNTAIVAIVVLVLVGVFAFFLMNGGRRGGGTSEIRVNVEKPAEAVKDAMPSAPSASSGTSSSSSSSAPSH